MYIIVYCHGLHFGVPQGQVGSYVALRGKFVRLEERQVFHRIAFSIERPERQVLGERGGSYQSIGYFDGMSFRITPQILSGFFADIRRDRYRFKQYK